MVGGTPGWVEGQALNARDHVKFADRRGQFRCIALEQLVRAEQSAALWPQR
jgi:hypothetical protein